MSWNTKAYLHGLAVTLAVGFVCLAIDTTNTVLMVDQRRNLNVEGIASVEDVATNAAKAVVASQRAEVAQQTALAVSNSINTVAQNLMANNAVIYRSGFSDSFAPLVVFTDSDVLAIVEARWTEQSAARLVCQIDYVCTVNLGTTKPTVMHRATIDGGRSNFAELADANVTTPVYHAQGATLDLPNGVTGGVTETVTWGDRVLTFTGGVLMGVQ